MIDRLFGYFSKDMGIDLGTANTLVYVRGRGIVINEPSYVAINQKTGQVLSIGKAAKDMVGRTPQHIVGCKPLVDGVISDFEVTEQMLKYFIDGVHKDCFAYVPRPRVVIGIPSQITEVEKRAVEDAARNAGAREVYLVEEPVAAAVGARMPIHDAIGNMIVDIGGAMEHSIKILVNAVKAAVELTPPELVSDLTRNGIVLTGGGSLLRGLNTLIEEETKIPVRIAEDPLTSVVIGTGVILENLETFSDILVKSQYES